MKLIAFLNLIRWKNLLLIIYVQLLLKFIIFSTFHIETYLNSIQFILLLVSILFITAAGYIINDLSDIKADLVNKPRKVIITKHISIDKAQNLYFWFNSSGVVLGVILSLNIKKPSYAFIFIGASLLLYFYSKKYKSKPLIGNIIVSLLVALNVLILYIFDIQKISQDNNQQLIIEVIFTLTFFAFILNFIREIIKDIEDIDGDYKLKMNTLPILIGQNRTKFIVSIFHLIPVILLTYIIVISSSQYKITALYLLLCTLLPLLFILLKMKSAKTKKDFTRISLYLKIIMFLGINSLLIFSINQ